MYTYIHIYIERLKKNKKNWTTSFFSTNKIWSYCGDARWVKYIKCVSAESEVVLVLSCQLTELLTLQQHHGIMDGNIFLIALF